MVKPFHQLPSKCFVQNLVTLDSDLSACHLLQEADVLVVGEIVFVERKVVDVGQVHHFRDDVVQRLEAQKLHL